MEDFMSRSLPGYEDLFITVDEPGIQCGCNSLHAGCVEGKRLQEVIAARYRNCIGLYGRRVRSEAVARWREACEAYQQHLKDNHRD